MAGLLTCGSLLARTFPDDIQWSNSGSLTAYSCGGSYGIDVIAHAAPYSHFISQAFCPREPSPPIDLSRSIQSRRKNTKWAFRPKFALSGVSAPLIFRL